MEDRARNDQADRDDETLLGDADALDRPSIEEQLDERLQSEEGDEDEPGS